ncbi:hypothetical protein RhiirC2_794065 [Rhizophagus irregularis]|uniref:HCP-like protein n=1 Tax=Rhizophagus irregularis TaxID=588596 RepID=A0A2N1MEE7_9GLOM|nr:hypothetical protein RhiirC2_794065 [Rhizophagus irregularis]
MDKSLFHVTTVDNAILTITQAILHIKVAEFGLAKKASEASKYSTEVYGLLPYIDPRSLMVESLYVMKVSIQYDARLAMNIVGGKREEIIKGTPIGYSNIYKACWEDDPDERPSIKQVVSYLKSINQDINEETNSNKFVKNEIKRETLNEDFDYIMMDDDLIIDEDFLNSIIQNDLLINITDSDDVEKIIDKLIVHLIKMHDEFGYGKGIDQDLNKAVYWYKKAAENGYEAAYYCLGKCHQDGIDIEKDEVKAFEYYKKSAEKEYLNEIYIIGCCYENEIGTEIDKE